MTLIRATIRFNATQFQTIDTPEGIGPWIARMFELIPFATDVTISTDIQVMRG